MLRKVARSVKDSRPCLQPIAWVDRRVPLCFYRLLAGQDEEEENLLRGKWRKKPMKSHDLDEEPPFGIQLSILADSAGGGST